MFWILKKNQSDVLKRASRGRKITLLMCYFWSIFNRNLSELRRFSDTFLVSGC